MLRYAVSYVITGNPGVGKHTVAKSLSKILKLDIIDINEVAKESELYTKNNETLDVDTKKLKSIIKKRIKERSIIVGHLAPYVVPNNQVKLAIILRMNPYRLEKIYKKRGYSKDKIVENIGSEILGVIAYDAIKSFGKARTIQIQSDTSVPKTIKKIKGVIDGKKIDETPDWLALITRKNDLKKFFPYQNKARRLPNKFGR